MSHPLLDGLFPDGIAVACARTSDDAPPLWPEEQALVERAVDKRRREFAHGRACARRGLAELGVEPCAVLAAETREPIWPSGFVGTISHDQVLTVAAVARAEAFAALGVDVEPDEPLEAAVASRIWTPEEAEHALGSGVVPRASTAKLVFVAKEAFYKCQFGLTQKYLGFRSVRVKLAPLTFEATLVVAVGPLARGTRFTGCWRREGGELVATMAVQAPGLRGPSSRPNPPSSRSSG